MREHGDDDVIRSHRELTESRLSDLLEQTKSSAALDDIKRFIFDESGVSRPSHYFSQLMALFHTPENTIDDRTLLPVIQDAWNYFPHLRLNGHSPAELLTHASRADVIVSQLPEMRNVEVDDDKIDDAVLALLLLGLHAHARVWKGHDWAVLDRLFRSGHITDPASKAKSVMLTELGLVEAPRLFKKLFSRYPR
jgi:uncharacterized protein DUF6429